DGRHALRHHLEPAGQQLGGRRLQGPCGPGQAAQRREVCDRPLRRGLHDQLAHRGAGRRRCPDCLSPRRGGADPGPRRTASVGGTQALCLEEREGIEPIPSTERKGSPRDVAWLWVAAFANFVSLITGGLLITFGLGVAEAIMAVAVGSVLAAILHGMLSVAGPRYGTTQVVAARHAFGVRGGYGGAFFTVFLAVGWFAVDCVIAALALGQLARLAGLPQGNVLNGFALVVVVIVSIL